MSTTSYKVEGMTCQGCVRSLTKAVQEALPNVGVEVSLEASELRIEGAHDRAKVTEAVDDAGFDLKS